MSSWQPAPVRSVGRLIVWRSADHWLSTLVAQLSGECASLLKRHHVRLDTVRRVALDEIAHADHAGRGVATAHDTVARSLGIAGITVQRARAVIRDAGFSVTVTPGRYLTIDERAQARRHHGGRQLRCASTRALIMPSPALASTQSPSSASVGAQNDELPRQGFRTPPTSRQRYSPARADARLANAAPRRQASKDRRPYPLTLQRLAAALTQRIPWLRSERTAAVCAVLGAECGPTSGWTAVDLIDHIDLDTIRRGWSAPRRIRRPLPFLRGLLRRAQVAAAEAPARRRARERSDRLSQLDASRAAETAERALRATRDRVEEIRAAARLAPAPPPLRSVSASPVSRVTAIRQAAAATSLHQAATPPLPHATENDRHERIREIRRAAFATRPHRTDGDHR